MTDMRKAEMLMWLRVMEAIIVIVTAPILLGLGMWAMNTIVRHDTEIALLKQTAAEGSRYTGEQAAKDFGNVVEKINDHELRIRTLERSFRIP